MKRILAVLAVVALFALPAFAEQPGAIVPPAQITSTWIASASSTLYSDAIDLFSVRKESAYFGAQYAVTSVVGDVSLTSLTAEVSNDNTNFAVPDSASAFVSAITDESQHYTSFTIPPARYLRFKSITGAGATDTVVTLKLYLW